MSQWSGLISEAEQQMNPFQDSNLRVKRAKELFESLHKEVQSWLDRRTYSLSVRTDAKTGEQVITIGEVETLPSNWALVATEIVQHLRSSLDNAIHGLTIAHTGQEMKGTEFPVFIDKKGFDKQGTVKMRGVSPACQTFIESMQPFNNPKPSEAFLWGLHELSNASKHQALPLLEVFRKVDNTTVGPVGGVDLVSVKFSPAGPLKPGVDVARWKAEVSGPGSVNVNFQLSRDISLDVARPPVLRGHPLIRTLDIVGNTAAVILRELHNLHAPPSSPALAGETST